MRVGDDSLGAGGRMKLIQQRTERFWMLGDFERGIWFKYKACSLISSGGVLLYVEHWVRLCNAVIGAKNRSNCVSDLSHGQILLYGLYENLVINRLGNVICEPMS